MSGGFVAQSLHQLQQVVQQLLILGALQYLHCMTPYLHPHHTFSFHPRTHAVLCCCQTRTQCWFQIMHTMLLSDMHAVLLKNTHVMQVHMYCCCQTRAYNLTPSNRHGCRRESQGVGVGSWDNGGCEAGRG